MLLEDFLETLLNTDLHIKITGSENMSSEVIQWNVHHNTIEVITVENKND